MPTDQTPFTTAEVIEIEHVAQIEACEIHIVSYLETCSYSRRFDRI